MYIINLMIFLKKRGINLMKKIRKQLQQAVV
jgi:hypothetical protein